MEKHVAVTINKELHVADESTYWTDESISKATRNTMLSTGARRKTEPSFHGHIPDMDPIRPMFLNADDAIDSVEATIRGPLGNLVTDVLRPPALAVGLLVFTTKNGNRQGSAAAVMNDIIITAAHNLFTDGHWHSNFRFFPAYPNLKDAAGRRISWGYRKATVPQKWVDYNGQDGSPADGYDFGMLLADRSLSELYPLGLVWNLPVTGRKWDAYGYPIKSPYPEDPNSFTNPERMYKVSGNHMYGVGAEGNEIKMSNNDFTFGASGGPWLTDWNGRTYVNSVGTEYNGVGPYFGGLVLELLKSVRS